MSRQSGVRGDDVAGLEQQDVTRHDLGGRYDDRMTVAKHARLRGGHRTQGEHGAFGAVLLVVPDERVDPDDRADRDRVHELSERTGDDTRAKQQPDHRTGELTGEDPPPGDLWTVLDLVAA